MTDTLRFASWNVNSLKVRLPQLRDWLQKHPVDAIGIQELKQSNEDIDPEALADLGYHSAIYGQKTYNGVAIYTRHPLEDIQTHLPDPHDPQARGIAATIAGIRFINLYVPNGQSLDSDKYPYKLHWLESLHSMLKNTLSLYPQTIVGGDFNIAPADLDVYDPDKWQNKILCSQAERAALQRILHLGLIDSYRHCHPDTRQYSWWDYRMNAYKRDRGLRIDLLLCSKQLDISNAGIDREPRENERPSDHTPVWVEIKRPD